MDPPSYSTSLTLIPHNSSSVQLSDLPILPNIPTPSFTYLNPPSSSRFFSRPSYYIHSHLQSSFHPYQLSTHDLNYFDSALPNLSLNSLERLIERWENLSGLGPAISKSRAMENLNIRDKSAIKAAYHYWLTRRKKLKHPLTRSFWRSSDCTDENIWKVFCRRKGEKMKLRSFRVRAAEERMKIQKIYCKLVRIREILIWVMRRECVKANLMKIKVLEFEEELSRVIGVKCSIDIEEILRNPIIENSMRYRILDIYRNHYGKIPPRLKLRS